jgi:hypothetical protein
MKQKDWFVIGAVAVFAAIVSFLVSGAIFGSPQKHPIKVPDVTKITSDFPNPQTDDNYKAIYNQNAFNPTELIQIGPGSNTSPFQSIGQ